MGDSFPMRMPLHILSGLIELGWGLCGTVNVMKLGVLWLSPGRVPLEGLANVPLPVTQNSAAALNITCKRVFVEKRDER
jgi:hypothetical protein